MAGRKSPSQAETMIGGPCFLFTAYPLHATGARGRRAPVTLFILRGGDKEDPLQEVRQEPSQIAGRIPAARSITPC